MEDEDFQEDSYVDISSISYNLQKGDRGNYIVLSIFSTESDDPIGSIMIFKNDPNFDRKIEIFKLTFAWLNNYLKGENGKS